MSSIPAGEKEFTYSDVAEHTTKKDIHVVIHDEVYNASSFIDEHPGGEEVLMDVAGQDATEAFEDVGHSDEAREILQGLAVGKLKRQPGDPIPKAGLPPPAKAAASGHKTTGPGLNPGGGGGAGASLYIGVLFAGLLAFGAYQYLQAQQEK